MDWDQGGTEGVGRNWRPVIEYGGRTRTRERERALMRLGRRLMGVRKNTNQKVIQGELGMVDERQMGPSAVAFVEEACRGKKRVGIVGVQAELT